MKGKIAVIEGCVKCPYKAFDNEVYIGETRSTRNVAYCGYHKVGYDGTQIDIDRIINWEKYFARWKPTEQEPNYPRIPNNCPLPEGDDKSKW